MSRSAQNFKDLFATRSPRYPPPAPPHLEAFAAASSLILRKATTSVCNLLRRLCFKTACLFEFSMDFCIFLRCPSPPLDDDFSAFYTSSSSSVAEPLYLVPLSWWNDAASAINAGNEINGITYNVTSSVTSKNFGADDWLCQPKTDIVLEIMRGNVTETETGTSHGEDLYRVGDLHFALLSEWMFLKAFKWHNDLKDTGGSLLPAPADFMLDLFCLQICPSVLSKTNSLVIKINQKDNAIRNVDLASDIFYVDSGMLQISDFSGTINQIFIDEQKADKDVEQPDKELNLELQVYGLVEAREFKRVKMMTDQFKAVAPSFNSSVKMNGADDTSFLKPKLNNACALGLAGLHNLGNTCFMNSAIQCLAHTSDLVDYFLGDFRNDLNTSYSSGMKGELALAFGQLLRMLWAPGRRLVSPSALKSVISRFTDQYNGDNQHDTQEFLSFLLNGLHEDLNRVKSKPYIEVKGRHDRPDEDVADELWRNHRLCNDSIIGNLFEGQLRSTLVCPVCSELSITYDTFTSLPLPLPTRAMTLEVFSTDGVTLPYTVTISVPKHGQQKDLIDALSLTCCLKKEETLLVALVYESSIVGFLDELSASVDLIKDEDEIVAYRLPKKNEGSSLVVFTHECEDKLLPPSLFPGRKFGIPLVSWISNLSEGSQIRQEFLKILQPFLSPKGNSSNVYNVNLIHTDGDISMMLHEDGDPSTECERGSARSNDVQFYLGGSFVSKRFCIKMDGPVPSSTNLQVLVSWPETMVKDYVSFHSKSLPQVCKRDLFSSIPQEIISLHNCLDAFLKEEPLGPENMWRCPRCTVPRRASKKLDLSRLPEILVIHLKRFSYSNDKLETFSYSNDKLETFVQFPTVDFDLSNYMAHKQSQTSYCYSLYAISNHSGSMDSGHYTSYVQDRSNRWFEFNDSIVTSVTEQTVVSPFAYVLFYRRNPNTELKVPNSQ